MKTFEDKANDLIGQSYDIYKAHCWDLVMELIPEAPKLQGTAENLTKSVKHFKHELELSSLEEVQMLYNKDIVIMGRNDTYFHAGVYYEGGVIHASLNGVVYEPIQSIHRQYNCVKGLRV